MDDHLGMDTLFLLLNKKEEKVKPKKIISEYEIDDMEDMNLVAKHIVDILEKVKKLNFKYKIGLIIYYQENPKNPLEGDVK